MQKRNTVSAGMDHDSNHDRRSIQVIERAAAILRALQSGSGGLSLGEISKTVELPRSTVQRIVDALAKEGLVIASSSGSGVRLGPALIPLGAATRYPLTEMARPTLENLAQRTGESVDLSIANQVRMVFLDQIASTHRLSAVSAIGVSFPLHCSANGKAALALMTGEELARTRKSLALSAFTKNTITSWEALEKELEEIRRSGIAYDREEQSAGICAIAKGFRLPTGELASISIPVPSVRFGASEAMLAEAIESECRLFSK
ncbi:IclR family transcriptional regulator [Noviherbaspirillum denitrificans]|uniref:IclR family transcriptional regulator n=1 Tax=Noviherbaspirillum denitrificans TaxID=1968433 RepID=A0A254T9N5_9BURK|nr:IclR family transcriptional regulator [Noviherbaspirillum denitrificans]OWW19295.1 hypothetical protein AYR66_07060 [Noviherbaspirillum denitrificans]